MPRTYNNVWPEIITFENIYQAYKEARKSHRDKPEVVRFTRNLIDNIYKIQTALRDQTWKPCKPWKFVIYEPKKRTIQATTFYDRVVHHAVMDIIDPYFQKKFIHHTYACLPGKGFHHAALQVQQYMKGYQYALKCDISSFFPTINHSAAMREIRRTIRDKQVLWFMDMVIQSHGNVGMGIGSLTSQSMAGIILNPLDHFVKDHLGVKSYVRYMDDFIILSNDKPYLHNLRSIVSDFLEQYLKQKLNPKSDVYPIRAGVDFCGYRIFPYYMLPRKRNIRSAKNRLRKLAYMHKCGIIEVSKIRESLMSFLGYLKHCRSWRTRESILDRTRIKEIAYGYNNNH